MKVLEMTHAVVRRVHWRRKGRVVNGVAVLRRIHRRSRQRIKRRMLKRNPSSSVGSLSERSSPTVSTFSAVPEKFAIKLHYDRRVALDVVVGSERRSACSQY
jgi:hypothetical protein